MPRARTLYLTLAVAALVALAGPHLPLASAEEEPKIPAETREWLDHLIGSWQSRWDYLGPDGKVAASAEGSEEVRYVLDESIVELSTEVPALGSKSKAWFFYNVAEKKVYLTSVDLNGDYWVLTGPPDGSVITSLPKKGPDGREMVIRFTHHKESKDRLRAVMEISHDDGETWTRGFVQTMERVVE